jgi:hypothetical protein
MKATGSNQNTQSSQGQKPHSAGISNRPLAREEEEQRQLPPRGQAKKGTQSRSRSGASAKG